jgi:lactoylglutathione lyase
MRRLEFTSLQVKDLEASIEFYTNKLGFELSEIKSAYAVVFTFNKGEASFAIRTPLENIENKELGVGVSLWFAIDEKIEDLEKNLTEKGVDILAPISDTPFGKILQIKDLDGYRLTFLEMNKKN